MSSILIAGHVVIDEVVHSIDSPPKIALGGPISYSSISLASLGHNAAIVTRVGEDFPNAYSDTLRTLGDIDVEPWRVPGYDTTRYAIDLSSEKRKLRLASKCLDLSISDFHLSNTDGEKTLVVNPVAGEISLSLLERISKEFDRVLADSQGFVRRISKKTGEVSMRSGLDISSLAGVDVLKADKEELRAWAGVKNEESAIRQLSNFVDTIIVTSGGGGVRLYEKGKLSFTAVPPKVRVAETIGAGDIMLSTFGAALLENRGNQREALKFAVAAGALAVRNYGVEKAILSRSEIEITIPHVELIDSK
jgi:sugar/nucleoside kinase (ribokinase family)